MKSIAKALAWISLAACIAIPYLAFRGAIGDSAYRTGLAVASLAWFVFATWGLAKRA